MTTRQNEVRRILRKLNGEEPDDGLVSRLANIAEAAEIAPGDALFPLMVALDYYAVMYEGTAERIKEASAFVLREHVEALRAETAKLAEEHKGQLEDATKKLLISSSQWLQQSMPGILKTELEKAATLAVREPVNAAAMRFEQATEIAEQATEKLRKVKSANLKMWVFAVLLASVIGGAAGGSFVIWAVGSTANSPDQKSIDRGGR